MESKCRGQGLPTLFDNSVSDSGTKAGFVETKRSAEVVRRPGMGGGGWPVQAARSRRREISRIEKTTNEAKFSSGRKSSSHRMLNAAVGLRRHDERTHFLGPVSGVQADGSSCPASANRVAWSSRSSLERSPCGAVSLADPAGARLPDGQVAEAAAAVDVVPELGRDHAGQRHVEDEPGGREPGEDGLRATAA